ncbi:hypothetical protein ABPG72_012419 [Tetrahymena utriculariae]
MMFAGQRQYSNKIRKYSEDVADLSFIGCENDSNNLCDSSEFYYEGYISSNTSRKNSCYILQQSDDKPSIKNLNINQNKEKMKPKCLLIESQFQDFAILDQIDENESTSQELTQEEWEDIFQKNKIDQKLIYKLSNSLFKGISYSNRTRLWPILAKVDYMEQIQLNSQIKDSYFKTYCQYENEIQQDLAKSFAIMQIQNKNPQQIENINEDLLTISKKICRAYAHFDKEVGYVENMSFIVLAVVYYLHSDNDKEFQDIYFGLDKNFEKKAFWIFVHIMYQKQWRIMFIDGQPGLSIVSKNIEKKMQQYLPVLNKHIINLGVSYLQLFEQDLLTIFQKNINRSLGERMFDMFLLDGEEIFYTVYLVIIKAFEKTLLKINNKQQLIKYVQGEMKNEWYEHFNTNKSLNFDEYQNELNHRVYTQTQL